MIKLIRKKVVIRLRKGLQARSATNFVWEANRFASDIFLEKENKKLNAKSIMGLMSMVLTPGSEVILTAEGVDEKEAVETLELFVANEG